MAQLPHSSDAPDLKEFRRAAVMPKRRAAKPSVDTLDSVAVAKETSNDRRRAS